MIIISPSSAYTVKHLTELSSVHTHSVGLFLHKLLQGVQIAIALVTLEVIGLLVEKLERWVARHVMLGTESSFHRAVHLHKQID